MQASLPLTHSHQAKGNWSSIHYSPFHSRSCLVATEAVVGSRVALISRSTGLTPSTGRALIMTITSCATWHLHVSVSLSGHTGGREACLRLLAPSTTSWAWSRRLMSWRIARHGVHRGGGVRSSLWSHRARHAILRKGVACRVLRRIDWSLGLGLLWRIPVELTSRRTILAPLESISI